MLLIAKKQKSKNWYIKLEDKEVMSHYNSIDKWEHCLFEPSSSMGKEAFSIIRGCVRTMIVSFVLFVWLCISLNPFAVLPLWSFMFAATLKDQVEAKMTSGYPYLEHTNAMGMIMIFIISVPIIVVLFFVLRFLFKLISG
jgi:hypothetical protein